MILRTAWKNVWRNKTRSMVVIASVTIGIFAGIFAVGLMNGTMEQRVDAAINKEISHIQLNRETFRDNDDLHLTLDSIRERNRKIRNMAGVEAITNRLVVNAIANTASKSTGIQLIGINPDQDKKAFNLHEAVIPGTGSYFNRESRHNLALVGEDLAKELNIIRYELHNATMDSLRSAGIPENVLKKLNPMVDKRYASQDLFVKDLKKHLTKKMLEAHGQKIMEHAWTFRERSRLTLTFLDKDNVQTGGMFRIAGIYDIKNSMYEKSHVFVQKKDLQQLTGLGAQATHKIIVRIADREQTKQITEALRDAFPALQVQNWKEISPDLAMMTSMIEKFNAVFMIIILAALSFGIVNTMLMVVLERTKELGMLTAIGMNKKKVFTMIMSESVFLSLVGGVAGMIVSKIILMLTNQNGINFSSAAEGFEAMGFSAHIYPTISNTFFITVTALIIITGILSSVYPAIKALKLDPADALRTE
ncbi:MAG: FtsX-like permease family protein [Bacteroidales bacterium]|nr:FtsX-like permease family protein [Bacteroidales bacterium]MDT8430390.1 FtsX-like permease family protein [Bacteroidales bacterium]